jgi:succinate dehydrogenase / fumarate reductase membrane anchor subunit
MMTTNTRTISRPKPNFDTKAWMFMRYSAVLLIPLVFGHLILQDVIVGVHRIDLDYVALRWASLGWRIYDALLLAFAFAHGVNGIRQVLNDYILSDKGRKIMQTTLLLFYLLITAIGAIALIGGVRPIS